MNMCRPFLASLLCIGLWGCFYDVGEELRRTTSCPDSDLSFSKQILPILDQRCNSCHDAANAFGSVVLDTYESVQPYVQNGSLLGSIRHEAAYSAMPPDQGKIPDCEIAQISIWINEGAPNN